MRVVYDGATGTNIGVRRPSLDDFLDKEGCNELLVLSRRYILPKGAVES
jgi:5-methyltetrahydrofolate--homocysteine methyltransferase